MKQRKSENLVTLILSLSCVGITVESILMGWEFWVPPLVVIGIIMMWVMNLLGKPDYSVRKAGYMIFAMLVIFYHGVHDTSFFDVAIVIILAMSTYSFFDSIYMLNLLFAEYIVIILMQMLFLQVDGKLVYDELNISRIILHFCITLFVYFSCKRAVSDRLESIEADAEKLKKIENNDADMEDFLSNISHELRTPVNVVNGMSDLLIKRNAGSEANTIKEAGIRLAYQIEDIQDYTECKRKKLLLEEDDYMSTSLINDVVACFKLVDAEGSLELVVDMAPAVPAKLHGDIKKLHKMFRHLLENAVKFTKHGGVYVRMYSENTDYGVNLCIEMTDTGIGMDRRAINSVAEGMYQVNKKRNRSSGGIGLGLFIVYGFAHRMGGFVKIESEKNLGTTVRVTIPQKVVDDSPCLELPKDAAGDILFHVRSDKYEVPRVRDFYRYMATNLATGLRVPLYAAETINDIERLMEKLNVKYIFMGQEEYEDNPEYFDRLSKEDIVVAVSAYAGFKPNQGSGVITMPKPLYGYPVLKVLKEGKNAVDLGVMNSEKHPGFTNVRILVVDDEPMNLVVATGIFSDYGMITDTAGSGKEAIQKFSSGRYDLVFMDHMMPEMDGVEAMKKIKRIAEDELNITIPVVVLTANVISGAKEMFIREGFDGFVSKPINRADLERVMLQVLPERNTEGGDGR